MEALGTTPGAARASPGPGPRSWNAAAIAIALALVAPIAIVAANVFVPGGEAWAHLSATVLPDYALNSLLLVAMVAAGTSAVGVACAWLVTAFEFPGRRVLEWALALPLAMPAYVIAYAYTDALQFAGPVQSALRAAFGWSAGDYWFPEVRSLGGAGAMFVAVLYPYVYLLARSAFLDQSPSLAEAGRTLGLPAWRAFFRVNLPLARPAIAAGAALACMETLADFGTVSYFGVQTFTTGIFRAWLSMGEPVSAAKLSMILLAFVAALLAAERLARRRARFHDAPSSRKRVRVPLSGGAAAAALATCLAPLAIGFAIPAAILARLAWEGGDERFGERFAMLAANSFTVSAITAAIAVALAVVMAYGARISRGRLAAGVNRLALLGYAVPGAVIAIGVLIPAAKLDNLLGDAAASLFGISTGLLLTGSLAALVYAYLIRFLAVALQSVEAGLARITPAMEDAARSLGLGPAATLARVHLPMMRSSLVTAALLVFVDVMKELPATFVMRPFNFDTLAVQAYNLAADERLAEASTASLAIVTVGLVPLVIAARRMVRPERPPGQPG
ncbi:MAG: iron ABC transporter permease [Burkholderiales bacterium]|nr:iron ABC transporter permease [Burkholderiales bacterium]